MAETTFNTRLGKHAADLINGKIVEIVEVMAAGHLELPQYKLEAGRINGLRLALALLEQAQTDMMKN